MRKLGRLMDDTVLQAAGPQHVPQTSSFSDSEEAPREWVDRSSLLQSMKRFQSSLNQRFPKPVECQDSDGFTVVVSRKLKKKQNQVRVPRQVLTRQASKALKSRTVLFHDE